MGIKMIQSNQNNPEKYKMEEFAQSPELLTVLHRGPHLACRHLLGNQKPGLLVIYSACKQSIIRASKDGQ